MNCINDALHDGQCTSLEGMGRLEASVVQVDNWVYDEANTTFIDDDDMQKRLMDMNPNSFRKLVATFLEANGRGYWEATPDQLDRLRQLYMDVEDKIEGVD